MREREPRRFVGRTAIVTGASRGIGRGIAERLVAEGARVCITGRKSESLEAAVDVLGGAGSAIGIVSRADDPDSQDEVIARTLEEFGSIDMLVNNAGVNPVYGNLLDLDIGAARKTFEVNALAPVIWTQKVVRAWMGEHGGSVVNVSSASAIRPYPGIGFYGATKAMLSQLTRSLAIELGPAVRINAIAPAVIKTDFAKALYEQDETHLIESSYPMGRLGLPSDVGGLVAFLLSADASWLTGEIVVLDGGSTIADHLGET